MTYMLKLGATLPAGCPPLAAFEFPVRTNLLALHFLGHGADVAAINFGSGDDARVIGAPTWDAGFATMSAAAYLQTDVAETADMTFVGLVRRPTDTSCMYWGNNTSAAGGIGLYSTAGFQVIGGRADRDTNTGESINLPGSVNPSSWHMVAMRVPNAAATVLNSLTNDASATAAATATRLINGGGDMRIGAGYNPAFPGACDVSWWAAFDRVLSDGELVQIEDRMRTYAVSVGITA